MHIKVCESKCLLTFKMSISKYKELFIKIKIVYLLK